LNIIRFIFISIERQSTILKNLNKTEEEKISQMEIASAENYIKSRVISEIEIDSNKINIFYDYDNYNYNNNDINFKDYYDLNITHSKIKIVDYYPNSKNEILDLLYDNIDIWFFLGNVLFTICTLSLIYCKKNNLEGDFLSTQISLAGLSKFFLFILKI
jgi:hypothetical protein